MLLVLITFSSFFESVWGQGQGQALWPRAKPMEEVVRGFGYDLETHPVVTSDGYKLTVHRLLPGPAGPASDIDRGVPVLIVPGALQSSASMLVKGYDTAYTLVDHGFDVWLSNYRGNMYSQQHLTLSPRQRTFWNFTLHELGTKDLPAVIDRVLAVSHRNQLIYQGYSMGTAIFWIMASTLPEYHDKVAAAVALAPIARPSHSFGMDNEVSRNLMYSFLQTMIAAQYFEVLPYNKPFASTIDLMCAEVADFICKYLFERFKFIRSKEMELLANIFDVDDMCALAMAEGKKTGVCIVSWCDVTWARGTSALDGIDANQEATFKLIPYTPAGISARVVMHFIQIVQADRFQRYDYGSTGNQKRYGSSQPPEYDLKTIELPIYLVYSDKDEMSRLEDIEWLIQKLPHTPERRILSIKNFRHVDFNLNEKKFELLTLPLLELTIELAKKHRDALACVNNVGGQYNDNGI